ncbi:hypothetical protein, partial [Rhodoferax sp.]
GIRFSRARSDCIGIRQSLADGSYEWVVDNSIHNRSKTIWSKTIDESQTGQFTRKTINEPFRVSEMTRIVYDGASGGQFRFTLQEYSDKLKNEKSFSFDRDLTGDTVVGIKGKVFRIIKADNVNMQYAWVKFPQ